ncbi:MAG: fimbrillin family protein, partial [Rikenellaceae bacterium]|nr:fimbrillin family protein [Rikenellaceae bacterium]
NQVADILIADDLSVPRNTSAAFTLRHAASKLIVRLASNTFSAADLANATITLPQYTTGATEENGQFIPGTTTADITLDRSDANNAIAIIQPQRINAYGAVITVTINGRDYTANAGATGLTYNSGEALTMIVNLDKEGVTLSANVVDWTTDEVELTVLQVTTPAAASQGVEAGDVMNVYLEGDGDYSLLRAFTYNAQGEWVSNSTPLYWEDIDANPANLRASIIASDALNSNQVADVLIADDLSVPRNTSANFTLRHAVSKLIVRLTSDTFSAADLAGATITLPQYTTGGTEQNGQFVAGTTTANIAVDRSDTDNGIAYIQPQTISANNGVITVTINGRDYTVNASAGGITYNAGEALTMIVSLNKEGFTVSANVVDWDTDEVKLEALTVGTSVSGATGVQDGEEMIVYTGNASDRTQLTTFTYNSASNSFSANPTVYWESLSDPTTFYASILRQTKYNDTQLDDYLVAAPVTQTASNGVNFELTHPEAKVVVQLRSSDNSFSTAELADMTITLPNYATGATVDRGVFVPGTGTGNITVAKNVGDDGNSAIAIIQPQSKAAGTTVVSLGTTDRTYEATYNQTLQFRAGVSTVLDIDVKKTAVTISADAIDWEAGDTVSLVVNSLTINGELGNNADYFKDKSIYAYMIGTDDAPYVYTYEQGTSGYQWNGPALYWDNLIGQTLSLTGVFYPYQGLIPTGVTGNTASFPWNLPADQSDGYDNYDLLMTTWNTLSQAT